ncbi:hypothetical protein HPB48_006484 [Haemaphysalis longicornis]|uniref:Neurotransmitter-gated ion-channel ligand-binding domain-containing protein n=1 Tax=Haemaphysalis longicornis TaxID=44386 RepID=A0A9J6FJX1_HAELO|nr:hypothetical protein HPB48_006484 [Haemaphysalis longicornis]
MRCLRAVLLHYVLILTMDFTRQEPLHLESILPEDPAEYDSLEPPKENGKPTVVSFHFTVLSLDSIDEGSMTWHDHRLRLPGNMTAKYRLLPVSWLSRMWRPDSFFKNAKRVTFQEMTIPNHYIWLYADRRILYMVKRITYQVGLSQLKNLSGEQTFSGLTTSSRGKDASNGRHRPNLFKKLAVSPVGLEAGRRLTLLLSCAMKFETYPHDTQVCTLKIESSK